MGLGLRAQWYQGRFGFTPRVGCDVCQLCPADVGVQGLGLRVIGFKV